MPDDEMAAFVDGLRRQRESWGTVDEVLIGSDELGTDVYWTLHTAGSGLRHGLVTGPSGIPGTSGTLNVIRAMTSVHPQYVQYVAYPAGNASTPVWYSDGVRLASTIVGQVATRDMLAYVRALVDRNGQREFPGPDMGNRGLILTVDDAELVLGDPVTADHCARIVAAGGPIGFALVVALPAADTRYLAGRGDLLAGLTAVQHVEVVPTQNGGESASLLRRRGGG